MSETTSSTEGGIWTKREFWLLVALAIGMGLLVYRDAIFSTAILFTSDDNIGAMALRERWLPAGFWRVWDDSVLAGQPALLAFNWTNLLLWLLPVRLFQNVIHAADLAVATIGFGLFMRARGIRLAPSLLGALTAFWLGSTFFLTYAGHIGKFGVVMFAALALWLIERAAQKRSVAWGALAGVACGGMFLEQADVATFFAMVLGPYALFALAREHGWDWKGWLKPLLPMGTVAFLVAARALWMATSFYAFETADQPAESKAQVWEYCTQWSWPPEETIEWVAPGFYGWRSGEPTGPYWGRLGRSANWETSRQGFPNFKLETLYIGAIPLAFALLGIAIGFKSKGRAKADAIFWTAAAVVTFILGCGKFTPLYRLFFELPAMSSIRGPVKFMQVTQFALGVLAAYGFSGLLSSDRDRIRARFQISIIAAAGLFLLWALILQTSSAQAMQTFVQQGWGNAASAIVGNRTSAVAHAGFFFLLLAGVTWALRRWPVPAWAWVVVGLVVADQLTISRHYVATTPASGYIQNTVATDFLKENLKSQRLFLATQGGFYNQWLTVLLPYQGIETYNPAQIRMPKDYQQFLEALGNRPALLWQHFAIGFVMGPANLWPELQNGEAFRDRFKLAFAFNVFPQGGGVAVSAATPQQPGQNIIAQHVAPAPRYATVAGWEVADETQTLERLRSPSYTPFQRVLVPPSANLPASTGSGLSGSIEVQERETGRVKLRVATSVPTVLRMSDKYTPYWRATVNGVPTPVFRTDHVFTGIYLEPGMSTVVVEHLPTRITLAMQAAGLAFGALALVSCARRRKEA